MGEEYKGSKYTDPDARVTGAKGGGKAVGDMRVAIKAREGRTVLSTLRSLTFSSSEV